jgi:hypothetical protein
VTYATYTDKPYPTTLIPNAAAFVNYVTEQVDVLGSHNNLIIEPYNEPWCQSDWATQTRLNEWQTIWQNCVNGIRNKENTKGYVHHLIIVQSPGSSLAYWGNLNDNWMNLNWLTSNPLIGDNLVPSIHCYRYYGSAGSGPDHSTDSTDYTTIKNIYIAEKLQYYSQLYPIFIGEISGITYVSGESTWLTNTLQMFNEWEIGYTYFAWRDDQNWANTGFGMLVVGSESTTGGTVDNYGQIFVDAIAQG